MNDNKKIRISGYASKAVPRTLKAYITEEGKKRRGVGWRGGGKRTGGQGKARRERRGTEKGKGRKDKRGEKGREQTEEGKKEKENTCLE